MEGWFEKNVITVSYEEFLLKSQAYNKEKKFKTFREMVANDGRANSLHYKCSFPVIPFVNLLQNEIPGLKDNTGKPIIFKQSEFHVIDSDITDKSSHRVSITYTTEMLSLLDNFGDVLLLAYGKQFEEEKSIEKSFLLRIVSGLSFATYYQS